MSLALAAVLAAPRRARPVVAAGGAAFAVAVSYSFLTLGWHYPSDVFGGFLVAATWTLVCVGAMLVSNARRSMPVTEDVTEPVSVQRALAPVGLTVLAAAVVACLVLVIRPHAVVDYAQAHKAFVIGAAAIGAMSMALATAIMLAVRR
jgi:hypothetical protein